MNREFLIVPDFNDIEGSMSLWEDFGVSFEYDDFFEPSIYQNESEVVKRIEKYKSLGRDMSKDTLHGVFMDVSVTSADKHISSYSKSLVRYSLDIACELGVRGVVFHTGLISGLEISSYLLLWLESFSSFFGEISREYPSLDIYIENTFENSPEMLVKLKNRLIKNKNIKLCLDYAHAALSKTDLETWCEKMSPYTAHIHLNDNDLKNDLHQILGDGKIDFKKCKENMEKFLPKVPILLELNGTERQRKSLEFIKNL